MVAAAAIGAAATVAGGAISASGASSAAGAQSSAANNAAAQNLAQYQNNYNTENPYVQLGYNARNQLIDDNGAGDLYNYANYQSPYLAQAGQNVPGQINLPSAPQPMTQAQLEQTPGYQFNLSQGLKATQSAAAAKGLGVSGAALKGAATYATGLADNTYQNQFANAQQIYSDLFQNAQQGFSNQQQRYGDYLNLGSQDMANRQNQINALMNATTIGQNAASQVGSQGVQSAANTGNFLTQAGNAQAAGQVGTANALSSGLTGLASQYQQYNLLNNLFGNNAATSTSSLQNPFLDSAATAASGGSIFG